MDHRARHYGRVRKSYLVNTMRNIYGSSLRTNTQKLINLERRNKRDLEERAKTFVSKE